MKAKLSLTFSTLEGDDDIIGKIEVIGGSHDGQSQGFRLIGDAAADAWVFIGGLSRVLAP